MAVAWSHPRGGTTPEVVPLAWRLTVIEAIAACIGVADPYQPASERGPPRRPLFAPELLRIALRLSAV